MSASTPGPWVVNGKQSIRGNDGEYIARVNWCNGEANARLIAAAPALLAALRLIDKAESTSIALEYVQGIARAAIAKATGATS